MYSNPKKDLAKLLAGSPKLEEVARHEDFGTLAQTSNDELLNYLFGENEEEFGKFSEILEYILTKRDNKKDESEEGTEFSEERKIAHNLCTLFTNKDIKNKKLGKVFNEKSGLISRLRVYVNSNVSDDIVTSRFSQLVRNLISIKKDFISDNPWLLSPLLAYPNYIGYSTLLFTLLRVNPQFYKVTAMRASDFMRKAEKDSKAKKDSEKYAKCSFILLNIFSLLIKSDEFKVDHFNVEIVKDILDATLIGQRIHKLAFYEGIFVTSSVLKKIDQKSTIARYVKARGKAFYKLLGLGDMEIQPFNEGELKKKKRDGKFNDIIAAFPAFYKSGFKELFKLMFCKFNVVSSDFGRTCLDYIISMPEEKFNKFIDENDVKKLIMDYIPLLPNDDQVMNSEENIQFLNPHVILLAFYIIEGLPNPRGTIDNTIQKNTFCPSSIRNDPEFVRFIVEKILPFRQLVLPDLSKFHIDHAIKINAD